MQSRFIQFPAKRKCGRRWTLPLRWVIAVVLIAFLRSALAQTSEGLSGMRTIAVASMGDGSSAGAVRQRIVERLKKNGRLQVVDAPEAADGVLRGTSSIWATGTVVIDPRSNSSRQTSYQGYLSVELIGKTNQSLWSYLVTPSRFHAGSITNDLADQAASRLLNAVQSGTTGSTLPVVAGSDKHVALHAAGATLPAPLYLKWFESSGLPVSYDAVGSEAGIQQLVEGKVDFAASDMPLTDINPPVQLRVIHVPTVVGGVVPIYNLPDLGRDLYLTPEALAGIYSGTIRKWNDPRIRATNHGAHLPDADIAVVHRSDGSGTTFVWTSFLSLVSPEWKTATGAGARVAWPVGSGAAGNGGVAELVKKTPNAIGYVELIYAIQHELTYAAVRNRGGHFIKADLASITAAAGGGGGSSENELRFSLLNKDDKAAYPISTYTWLLVPATGIEPRKKTAISDLLNWILTSGQKQCASLGYAPLPREVAGQALHSVEALK
jgi:phosphate ABC transporter phosphate-binding protein